MLRNNWFLDLFHYFLRLSIRLAEQVSKCVSLEDIRVLIVGGKDTAAGVGEILLLVGGKNAAGVGDIFVWLSGKYTESLCWFGGTLLRLTLQFLSKVKGDFRGHNLSLLSKVKDVGFRGGHDLSLPFFLFLIICGSHLVILSEFFNFGLILDRGKPN